MAQTSPQDKQKVSLTLDRDLVQEIRKHFPGQGLSTSVNALLQDTMAQSRLRELVGEMEAQAGPASQETYEHVLEQWFADE